jgi:hypothetical protein
MKSYPSIFRASRKIWIPQAYIFDKLDGSNLRFEWNKKRGWYKFGTRTQLLNPEDPTFGPAIPLFLETLSEPLEKLAIDSKWESVVVFGEFYGTKSFAGMHTIGDDFTIKVFDIAPFKRGLLDPEEFLKVTENIPRAEFLGIRNFGPDLVDEVLNNNFPGVTYEGIVAKRQMNTHELLMGKAKTQLWIDAVKAKFGPEKSKTIIES